MKIQKLPLILIFSLILSGCNKSEPLSPTQIKSVKVQSAVSGEYTNSITYSGYSSADEIKRLSFETGGKISKLYVEKGDTVKSGQIIGQVDTESIRIAINNATESISLAQNKISQADASINEIKIGLEAEQLTLEKAQTGIDSEKISLSKIEQTYDSSISKLQLNLDNAQTTFENTEKLYQNGICDKSTYDSAKLAFDTISEEMSNTLANKENDMSLQQKKIESLENDYALQETQIKDMENKLEQAQIQKDAAQISLNQAKLSLEQNQKVLNDSVLKSNIDGYVVELVMKEGEVTSAGNPVVVIKSGAQVVNVGIPVEDYSRIKTGMSAKLTQDDTEIYGKVTAIDLYPDETTRTYNIKITPSENNTFALGSLVTVCISLDTSNEIFIPISSIITKDGTDYVYYANKNEDGKYYVKSAQVYTGKISGESISVTGIDEGTLVITEETKNLRENQRIIVEEG